jgi:hypothetical protein
VRQVEQGCSIDELVGLDGKSIARSVYRWMAKGRRKQARYSTLVSAIRKARRKGDIARPARLEAARERAQAAHEAWLDEHFPSRRSKVKAQTLEEWRIARAKLNDSLNKDVPLFDDWDRYYW